MSDAPATVAVDEEMADALFTERLARLVMLGEKRTQAPSRAEWLQFNAQAVGLVNEIAAEMLAAQLTEAQAELAKVEARSRVDERTAQLNAHRACISDEHDPANGKIHGYCVVCGVPWPCAVAVDAASVFAQRHALRASLAAAEQARDEAVKLLAFESEMAFREGFTTARVLPDRETRLSKAAAGAWELSESRARLLAGVAR